MEGFYQAAQGDDDAPFKAAVNRADDIYIRDGDTPAEKKIVGEYRDFRRRLQGEIKKLREFRKALAALKQEIPCSIPGERGVCRVAALYPDGSADVINRDSQRRRITGAVLMRSHNFMKSFVANFNDPHTLFYYGLMTRRFDAPAVKNAPKGFWARHLKMFMRAAGRR